MDYLSALRLVHEVLRPRSYCEIGCRFGYSLTLSYAPAVGIDPDFEIHAELLAPTRLYRMTSDDFFATQDVKAILDGPVDFAFIDGLHLAEYALRDFINLERVADPHGIIAIDDLLPQDLAYATRERHTQIWTGDVYRIIPLLRHYRPDLDIRIYDIEMKGFGTITGLDPSSTLLRSRYRLIEEELSAGRWAMSSPEAIRTELAPRSTDDLEPDLRRLAEGRVQASSATGNVESHVTSLYLELLKRSVLNEIYLDDELRILYLRACLAGTELFDAAVLHDIRSCRRREYEQLAASRRAGQFLYRNIHNSGFNHSMMGRARLDNLQACLDIVRRENLPGDLIECGAWRGGGCIFMAGYLAAYSMRDKNVFVADSFDGLPPPTAPADAGLDLSRNVFPELAVSMETVQDNFSLYGLDGPKVRYLKGWFKETLPSAPIEQLALLRIDGDLYESTMDVLDNLYSRVGVGGVIIVDDYGAVEACRQAIDDFFARRDLPIPEMKRIDWTGVWFRKAPAE